MGIVNRFRRKRSVEDGASKDLSDGSITENSMGPLLRAYFSPKAMTKEKALNIPAFTSSLDMLSGIVSALPIKLYKRDGDTVTELVDDRRVRLINGDTGDLLRGPEMIKRFVKDFYTARGAFIYCNWRGNELESLHYVDPCAVSVLRDETNHIFKTAMFMVDGKFYYPWQFIYACRDSVDGVSGVPLTDQSPEMLSTAYASLKFEQGQMQRGGRKRGYLKAPRKVSEPVLEKLKQAFNRLYDDDSENVLTLNEGLEFQEASETSVEMQMVENKKANADDIMSLFLIAPPLIRGGADEDDHKNFVNYCLIPLLSIITSAINSAMLLEEEKQNLFWDFDLKEFTKASFRERWAAWATAKKNGMVNADEFRRFENLPPLGMDYINLGLNDVLLDLQEEQIIVPNMGQVIDLKNPLSYVDPSKQPQPNNPPEPGDDKERDPEGGEKDGDKG